VPRSKAEPPETDSLFMERKNRMNKTRTLLLTGSVLSALAVWSLPAAARDPGGQTVLAQQGGAADSRDQRREQRQEQRTQQRQERRDQRQEQRSQQQPQQRPQPQRAQQREQRQEQRTQQRQEQQTKPQPQPDRAQQQQQRQEQRRDNAQQRQEQRQNVQERREQRRDNAQDQRQNQQRPGNAQRPQEQRQNTQERREERRDNAQERRDNAQERRDNAQERRQEQRRDNAQERQEQRRDNAQPRQDQRQNAQERREERRDNAQDRRQEPRENAQDRRQEQQRENAQDRREQQRENARDNARRIEDLRKERKETKEGNRTVIREGDRTIVRQDNRTIIRHDEVNRFRVIARDVKVERRGGETRNIIVRPGGVQIINVVDANGRLIRRIRRDRSGREIILIDNRPRGGPGFFLDLRPPVIHIPRDRYIVEAEAAPPALLYETLEAPPLMQIERAYSLDEIRYNPNLRARMRRIDIDTITFDTGSWEVTPDQAARLEPIAQAMQRAIEKNSAEVFLIEGHTDAVGDPIDNLTLSDRRAEAVAIVLTERYNIPPENLVTQGYGEQQLKIDTQGPERQNRRVSVQRITPLLAGNGGSTGKGG
jgi:outer membrane protein OmpA-like peptidoglycan-associated protein